MSGDLSDWPYDEFGSNAEPKVRIRDLLKDAGWDDDVFQTDGGDDSDEDFEDALDFDESLIYDRCECKIVSLFSAAEDLKEFLEGSVSRFPRDYAQVDSFAALGGWANGSWSYYLSAPSSVPFDEELGGTLHLFGCSKKGHSCRVQIDEDGVVSIKAERPELPNLTSTQFETPEKIESEDEQDDDLVDLREAREEKRYDVRTYAALDDTPEALEEEDEADLLVLWRDFFAPDHEIGEYVAAGLEPEDVYQIGRLMPRSDITFWVEEFKEESMIALDFLKIGLGELSSKEELEDLHRDDFRSSLAASIRQAVASEFKKFRNEIRVVEKVKKGELISDDFEDDDFDDDYDPEDDPYLDDEV